MSLFASRHKILTWIADCDALASRMLVAVAVRHSELARK